MNLDCAIDFPILQKPRWIRSTKESGGFLDRHIGLLLQLLDVQLVGHDQKSLPPGLLQEVEDLVELPGVWQKGAESVGGCRRAGQSLEECLER